MTRGRPPATAMAEPAQFHGVPRATTWDEGRAATSASITHLLAALVTVKPNSTRSPS